MDLDRRTALLAALASCMPVARARANAPLERLFPTGLLASNKLAKSFDTVPPGLAAPRIALLGRDGRHAFDDLRGKVRIVTLWAEWCAPCVVEMVDFAALNDRYGGPGFEILAILTSSQKKFGHAEADAFLRAKKASLPLWVEPNGGASLLDALAVRPGGRPSLPCNLIVDARGRLRGRSFGSAMTGGSKLDLKDGVLTEAGKAQMMSSGMKSTWATPAGDEFVKGLLAGALG